MLAAPLPLSDHSLMVCDCSDHDDEKKKAPPSDKKDDAEKQSEKSPEEQGVDSANDTFRKFLERSDED